MNAKLYVIPGSHPSMTARRMLEHKGIEYKRVDLVPALHKLILRALRFPGDTVPALSIDGRRVQGTTSISRELDRLAPDPPLFPADPERRRAVEEAERWGNDALQPAPRRLVWWAIRRNQAAGGSFLQGARLGVPPAVARRTTGPIAALAARYNGATGTAVRADLAALPAHLDHVDRLVSDGVIGGGEPNAADFQIGASLRLLMCFDDLRPAIEGRLAEGVARRVAPEYPGHIPPVLPEDWLQSLRTPAPAI